MLDGEREGGIDFDVLYGPHSLPGRQNSAVGHRARIRRRGIVIKRRGSVCVCVCKTRKSKKDTSAGPDGTRGEKNGIYIKGGIKN